jgi:spore coat protein CotH
MKPWLSVPLLLSACSAPNIALRPGQDDTDSSWPGDTDETGGSPVDTADTDTEHIPDISAYELSDPLFQLDVVHAVDITLSEASYASLARDPYTYVEAELSIDGEQLDTVGVRLKGRIGSFRELYEKAAFKVDLNRFTAGQTYMALELLNLNNMVQDSAQVHERIAYEAYRLAGVPAPRVGYAWVRVNGEDYGLYSLGEPYDDVFLDGRYEDASGNLYDGDYLWPGGSTYTKIDFSSSLHDLFELDEGEDVERADIHAVTATLEAVFGGQGFDEGMAAVVDMDEAIAMWAGDAWTGHYDSYTYNQNNYRVYFDPSDGLADLFPWDPDWAFYSATPVTSPSGLVSRGCKADTGCHQRFHAALDALCQAVERSDLEDQLDQAIALIGPYIEADPRKETTASSAAAYQEDARRWIRGRCASLEAMSGL